VSKFVLWDERTKKSAYSWSYDYTKIKKNVSKPNETKKEIKQKNNRNKFVSMDRTTKIHAKSSAQGNPLLHSM
jgi:hypothetical protein